MLRLLSLACSAVCLTGVAVPAVSGDTGQLKMIELRTHRVLSEEAVRALGLSDEIEEELLAAPPELSSLMRGWYSKLPADGRWSADGAKRSNAIILVDTGVAGHRFEWRSLFDFTTGIGEYTLTLWSGPDSKRVLRLELDYDRLATDMRSFIEEGRELRERGELGDNDTIPVKFELGGRQWDLTFAEWQEGDLEPQDRELLDLAVDESLLEELDLVAVFARVFTDLSIACLYVVAPLAGYEPSECEPVGGFTTPGGGPRDCEFDAWFGYPCDPKQDQRVTPPRRGDLVPPSDPDGG